LTQSEKAVELESRHDEQDKSSPKLKDELTGTLVTQTTHTEQADISPTTKISAKTTARPKPAKKSEHKQIIQDIAFETTQPKVILSNDNLNTNYSLFNQWRINEASNHLYF